MYITASLHLAAPRSPKIGSSRVSVVLRIEQHERPKKDHLKVFYYGSANTVNQAAALIKSLLLFRMEDGFDAM